MVLSLLGSVSFRRFSKVVSSTIPQNVTKRAFPIIFMNSGRGQNKDSSRHHFEVLYPSHRLCRSRDPTTQRLSRSGSGARRHVPHLCLVEAREIVEPRGIGGMLFPKVRPRDFDGSTEALLRLNVVRLWRRQRATRRAQHFSSEIAFPRPQPSQVLASVYPLRPRDILKLRSRVPVSSKQDRPCECHAWATRTEPGHARSFEHRPRAVPNAPCSPPPSYSTEKTYGGVRPSNTFMCIGWSSRDIFTALALVYHHRPHPSHGM